MKYNEIIGLMQEMNKAGLNRIVIETENFKLVLEKEAGIKNDSESASGKTEKESCSGKQADMPNEAVKENKDDIPDDGTQQYKKILSPMVGTFYAQPAPDKPPYVKAGDMVKKGQIVCIIEAMKLMNEIESEVDGEIDKCLVENEEMVEFGQPLFLVK